MTHLDALELRLSHEKAKLSAAKTQAERIFRAVTLAQCEREIAGEIAFLGSRFSAPVAGLSDEDLLAQLLA